MDKQEFADIVNTALKAVMTHGVSLELTSALQEKLLSAMTEYAPSSDVAAQFTINSFSKTFEDMIKVKGIPVRSIVTVDGENNNEVRGIGMDGIFDKLEPSIRLIYKRLIEDVKEDAIVERSNEINSRIEEFIAWTQLDEGTRKECLSDIRSTLKSINKWDKGFYVDRALDLIDEVEVMAKIENGAIAARWSYSPYPGECGHEALNNKHFLIRDSWAINQGLIHPSNEKYFDEAPRQKEQWGCRCRFTFEFHIRQLPESMLTKKGKDSLFEGKQKVEAVLREMEKSSPENAALVRGFREGSLIQLSAGKIQLPLKKDNPQNLFSSLLSFLFPK
jgi:hypothetical protein